MSNNEVAHLVYLQVKKARNLLLNTPYRVARSVAATNAAEYADNNGEHPVDCSYSNEETKMRDFTPLGYRSFLKRLPPPKRQPNNSFLDDNFDVTIGSNGHEDQQERPLLVAVKPKEARVPLYTPTRPTLTRSKLRRSQLLTLSASSNTDVFKLRPPEDSKPVDQRAELTNKLKKSYTKSETVITPKQFVLPTIDDKSYGSSAPRQRPHTMRTSIRPKWVTKVEIRKKDNEIRQ